MQSTVKVEFVVSPTRKYRKRLLLYDTKHQVIDKLKNNTIYHYNLWNINKNV